MFVIKRDGRRQAVVFDKISARIKKLVYGLDESYVDTTLIAQKTVLGLFSGIHTSELDELAAETAAHLTSVVCF